MLFNASVNLLTSFIQIEGRKTYEDDSIPSTPPGIESMRGLTESERWKKP